MKDDRQAYKFWMGFDTPTLTMTTFMAPDIDIEPFNKLYQSQLDKLWRRDQAGKGKGKKKGKGGYPGSSGGKKGIFRTSDYPYRAYTEKVSDENWGRAYTEFTLEFSRERDGDVDM